MVTAFDPEIVGFNKIKSLVETPKSLCAYIKMLSLDNLNALLNEVRVDVKVIEQHLDSDCFHKFIDKIPLTKKENKHTPLNSFESFVNFLRTFIWSGTMIFGVLMTFLTPQSWLLMIGLGITVTLGTLAGLAENYSMKKENEQLLFQKKMLNLEFEILQEINYRKIFQLLNKLAAKLEIEQAPSEGYSNTFAKIDENWWDGDSPTKMMDQLIGIAEQKTVIAKNPMLQKRIDKLRRAVENSRIESIFKQKDDPKKFTIRNFLQTDQLEFNKWWRINNGEVIRKASVEEGLPKAAAVFTIGSVALNVSKVFNFAFVQSFFQTAIGLAIISGAALTCFALVGIVSIFNQYNCAKREYEKEITQSAINKEKSINESLNNGVEPEINSLIDEIEKIQCAEREGTVVEGIRRHEVNKILSNIEETKEIAKDINSEIKDLKENAGLDATATPPESKQWQEDVAGFFAKLRRRKSNTMRREAANNMKFNTLANHIELNSLLDTNKAHSAEDSQASTDKSPQAKLAR